MQLNGVSQRRLNAYLSAFFYGAFPFNVFVVISFTNLNPCAVATILLTLNSMWKAEHRGMDCDLT